mmetsp:Transcript_49679/g.158924  ORF Transcript_49679/g.158924 Transcript_49679/m.158924 type:complete len:319 (-) Transcript_49679:178-1134(-)
MGAADEDRFAARQQRVRADEALARQVHVGAEDLRTLLEQQPAELEGERLPGVVAVGLEGHAQDAAARARERAAALRQVLLRPVEEAVGHRLVHQHGGVAQGEGVPAAGCELHRVPEEPRPRREAGPREARGTGVAVHDRRADAMEVQAPGRGDLVELVGRTQDHVAPGVQEELRHLRLLQLQLHEVHAQGAEEGLRVRGGPRVGGRDDLRDLRELLDGVAHGQALRAHADADVQLPLPEGCQDARRRPREERRPQQQALPAVQEGPEAPEARLDHREVRVQVLVHRGPDGQDDDLALARGGAVRCQEETLWELRQAAG